MALHTIEFKAEGAGTREQIAAALRLIANALDSQTEAQTIEDMDGTDWNDSIITTHCLDRND